MSNFYNGNLLLAELTKFSNFLVPDEGTWNILYADANNNPVLYLRVFDEMQKYEVDDKSQDDFYSVMCASLVIKNSNQFFFKYQEHKSFKLFDSSSLFEEFLQAGLVVSRDYRGKPFNSKASSVYHTWQSKHRFIGGITDIDVTRLGVEGKPVEVIEVKRSRISLEKWAPYFNDKGGYEILSKFCKNENLDFTVAYYHFSPNESIEDYENLLILKKTGPFEFQKLGTFRFDEFVAGKYTVTT